MKKNDESLKPPQHAVPDQQRPEYRRRAVLKMLGGIGLGTVAFQRALAAQAAQQGEITSEMIQQAEWIAGLTLSDDDRAATAEAVNQSLGSYDSLRQLKLANSVPPALHFSPEPQAEAGSPPRGEVRPRESAAPGKPTTEEDLAFLPVTELAALIRSRQVSSVELTKMYLERLHRYDALLKCVVTFTEDVALRQAKQADREIAAGRYRGPLHGIPWGAKDLIAYPPFATTWGADVVEGAGCERGDVAQGVLDGVAITKGFGRAAAGGELEEDIEVAIAAGLVDIGAGVHCGGFE